MAIRNFSAEAFGPGGGGLLVPRQKFNFTLILGMLDEAIQFTRVSNVTVPGYNFDTIIANQYNKKRVVQTKLNYDPITVNFYDTFDSQFHNIMRRYIAHYYNGGQGIESRTTLEGTETINASFITDLGYTPTADRYFFPRVGIVMNGLAGQHREISLVNPMITDVRGDTLDYSDSNPVMYTVTFQPESIQTLNLDTDFITDTSSAPNDFNVAVGGFGDETTSGTAVVTGEVAFFDTLVDALTFDGTLAVGGQANIAGVDAIIDATEDGTRFFLDAVTGEPLR